MVAEEVVDDGLRRGGEQAVRHALAAELHHLLQRRAMAVVELQEVPDQPRRVIDRSAQLLQVRRRIAEDRVLHGVAQVGEPRRGLVLQEVAPVDAIGVGRSEEHTSELQSLMRISYAVFCLKKKKHTQANT